MVKFLAGEGADAVFQSHGVDHGAVCIDNLRICGSPLCAGKQAGIIFRRHNAVAASLFQSRDINKRRRLIGHAVPNRAVLQPACGEHRLFLFAQLCAGGQACGNNRCHVIFCNRLALSSGNQRITRDGINIALMIQLSVDRIIIRFFGIRMLFQRHGITVGHGQLRFRFIIQRQGIFLRHICNHAVAVALQRFVKPRNGARIILFANTVCAPSGKHLGFKPVFRNLFQHTRATRALVKHKAQRLFARKRGQRGVVPCVGRNHICLHRNSNAILLNALGDIRCCRRQRILNRCIPVLLHARCESP